MYVKRSDNGYQLSKKVARPVRTQEGTSKEHKQMEFQPPVLLQIGVCVLSTNWTDSNSRSIVKIRFVDIVKCSRTILSPESILSINIITIKGSSQVWQLIFRKIRSSHFLKVIRTGIRLQPNKSVVQISNHPQYLHTRYFWSCKHIKDHVFYITKPLFGSKKPKNGRIRPNVSSHEEHLKGLFSPCKGRMQKFLPCDWRKATAKKIKAHSFFNA